MEVIWRRAALTAIAPIAWGATYAVTRHVLPQGVPLWGAALRALPAAVVLLALVRRAPSGPWWWRSLLLGVLNVASLFVLVYVAAQRLPTSLAATVMATGPFVLMAVARVLLRQRPHAAALGGAALGLVGVAVMLGASPARVDLTGVLASATALVASSVGYILATRWKDEVDLLASTAWQVAAGGLVLLVAAVAVEGAPPPLGGAALLGFAYVSLAATALAYVAWFAGLRRLPAGSVGLIGLLNPVTGLVLGVAAGGERLTAVQAAGVAAVLGAVVLGQLRTPRPADEHPPASSRLPTTAAVP
jgi:probable blue pigment (indigoidine) exporter